MAINIPAFDGQTEPVDGDFPNGNIKDDTNGSNGTIVNKKMLADMLQYFAKTMREAGIAYNNLPDDEYNGNQFFEALLYNSRPCFVYKCSLTQSGTNPPGESVMLSDIGGTITWGYVSTGVYTATYSGTIASIFSITYCALITPSSGAATIEFTSSTVLTIRTKDLAGVAQNGLLNGSGFSLEIQK